MSKWDDRVKNHFIWEELAKCGPLIDKSLVLPSTQSEHHEDLARLKAVLTFVGKRLEAVDAMLIAVSSLDYLGGQIRQANEHLTLLASDGDVGHLDQANELFDAVVGNLAQVAIPLTSDELGAIRLSAEKYRSDVENLSSWLADKLSAIKPALATATEELTAARQLAASSVESTTQSIQSQLATLTSEVNATKSRADAVISDLQKQFSQTQTEYLNQFSQSQEARNIEFAHYHEEWRTILASQREQLRLDRESLKLTEAAESEAILTQMRSHRDEIEALVGIIGNLGMTAGFQNEATAAEKKTVMWHWMTVGSMGRASGN